MSRAKEGEKDGLCLSCRKVKDLAGRKLCLGFKKTGLQLS